MKVSPLILFAVATLSTHAAYGETVAWWRFEQNFENEIDKKTLEIISGPDSTLSEHVPGKSIIVAGTSFSNKASYSNGSKSDSRLEDSQAIDQVLSKGPFTIEAFIKLESPTGTDDFSTNFCRIIGTAINESEGGWCWMIHQDKLRFYAFSAKDGKIVSLTSQAEISRHTWHHVAVVGIRDGDFLDLQLYIDGEAQPETVQIEGSDGNAIMPLLSACIVGGYNPFMGLIDELRISNEALSPSELLIAR